MITVKEVEGIHKILIDSFDGTHGIRDLVALDSALARPYPTFDGVELLPDPVQKAAALIESILINHPFIDGNKRTGYVLMRLLLISYNLDISASQTEKYDFVISVASGKIIFENIVHWLNGHVTGIEV
ncbi:MAG: type II toxin-antitoxin system death-on-curing family toxin [Chitinophagaceae bacterium]|nr:type II toxin-antitoxin system death-on-curing family toxin [Chitinophagaceae bacterium]